MRNHVLPNKIAWKDWLIPISLGIFAIFLRLYYVTHAQILQPVNQPNVRGDAVEYYAAAFNLLHHGVFSHQAPSSAPIVGDNYRDPGYPLFMAIWLRLFVHWDSWYAAMLLSQAVIGGLTVTLWLMTGLRSLPTPYLIAAGVLMAIWPHSIAMTGYLLSETLYGFLFALAFCTLRVWLTRGSIGWAGVSGACFALAALTNAVLLPFSPLLAALLFLRRQLAVPLVAAFVLGSLVVIAPWLARNATLSPGMSSSTRALTNLVEGSWPDYQEASQVALRNNSKAANELVDQISRETGSIDASFFTGLSLMGSRMAQHPLRFVRWYLSKPALMWSWNIRIGQGDIYVYPTRNSPFVFQPLWRAASAICQTLNPALFVLMIVGGLSALLQTSAPKVMMCLATALFFVTLIHTVLQAEPRYAVPYRGAEILLSLFAAHALIDRLIPYWPHPAERSQTHS